VLGYLVPVPIVSSSSAIGLESAGEFSSDQRCLPNNRLARETMIDETRQVSVWSMCACVMIQALTEAA